MARPSATALLVLLLSLLAVAHCRTLESDPATEASPAVAIADETGPSSPTDVTEPAVGATELVVPEEQHAFLRLPSHRRHRHHPCRHGLFHRHLWWARHHGRLFGDGHDAEPRAAGEEDEEVKPVAEPDPDRSFPDDAAAIKKEMLWRMVRHGLRHHHDDDEEDKEKKTRKMFHFHHHDDDEEEDDKKMRKPFHHAADENSDDDLEEMVRLFRKAIMRRRFHHGRRFFRHHHHHHAENAEQQADGEQQQQQEGGGVMTWIKGLMNRF